MTTKTTAPRPRTSGFGRHETFHLRYSWIAKGLSAIGERRVNFDDPGAHHELGVGINMLRSLGYWMRATRLARFTGVPKGEGLPFELTDIGKLIAEFDPYLEDFGTLWVIQYELASNKDLAPLWYWVFNLMRTREFTEETLAQGFTRFLAEEDLPKYAKETVTRDIKCFKRTYSPSIRTERTGYQEDLMDCPLAELGLIRESATPGNFSLQFGSHAGLPSIVFAYALLRYRETYAGDQVAISLDDLRWAPGSPGRMFCLNSGNTLDLLEILERETDLVRLTRSEGISQVAISNDVSATQILERYFRRSETNTS